MDSKEIVIDALASLDVSYEVNRTEDNEGLCTLVLESNGHKATIELSSVVLEELFNELEDAFDEVYEINNTFKCRCCGKEQLNSKWAECESCEEGNVCDECVHIVIDSEETLYSPEESHTMCDTCMCEPDFEEYEKNSIKREPSTTQAYLNL